MEKYITIQLSVPEVDAALRLAESLDPAKRSLGVKVARAWVTTPENKKTKALARYVHKNNGGCSVEKGK